jgi:hypothetical protein
MITIPAKVSSEFIVSMGPGFPLGWISSSGMKSGVIGSRKQHQMVNVDALSVTAKVMDRFFSRVPFIHRVGETVSVP